VSAGLIKILPTLITIAGTPVPVDLIPKLTLDVVEIVRLQESGPQAFLRLSKDLFPLVMAVSSSAWPGLGAAELAFVFMVRYGKPWTDEDRQCWWDRAKGEMQ